MKNVGTERGYVFMEGYELLRYKMDREELKIWAEMCLNIKKKFEALNLPPTAYETLDKKFFNDEPYSGSRGYSKDIGYYNVSEGDRGAVSVNLIAKTFEEAQNLFIGNLARDIGYACTFKDRDKIEQEHRHEWRYYEEQEGIVPGVHGTRRVIYRTIENATWKYDTEYDYRKYWFEMTLGILKQLVPRDFLEEEIKSYEESMNHHFENDFWKFNVSSMSFEQV